MQADNNKKNNQKKWVSHNVDHDESTRELVDELILQNRTLDALIKGLSEDIETFKQDKEGRWSPADIVRFTMQLNIMKDKKGRNLHAINEIIKKEKEGK